MLGQEQIDSSDKMWDELKGRASVLLDRLEQGDFAGISSAIIDLNEARDQGLYREVGKLTRGLHEAIVNFDLDAGKADAQSGDEDQESKMANAQDRLDYVIQLTQSSADKTMDMVEEGIPVASQMGDRAKLLREDWGRLIRREMDPSEFRDLYHRIDNFLEFSVSSSGELGEKLNAILLAQDFQDLTGQVIKKVIFLVQEVEERLVDLMRMAGQVEELAGIVSSIDQEQTSPSPELNSAPEGPQIKAEQRDDVVSGQDDVDDLLSSLGF
jgi:chemotaxis protein CheZ